MIIFLLFPFKISSLYKYDFFFSFSFSHIKKRINSHLSILIFSNRIFELRRKSSGAPQKGISEMSIKIILEMLQIAWYGTQLIKEMKELYKWYKKRADDNSPAPTNTTEQDIRPSSSDTTITVEKNKDCNININVYPKLDK